MDIALLGNRTGRLLAGLFALLIVLPASSSGTAPAATSQVHERSCHIHGFETPVRCVTITVPKDYRVPGGASLTIGAAIVPAVTARPESDPLFLLAGGPGQAATDLGPAIETDFDRVRRTRDIVLFDIRGTGLSSPLTCSGAPEGILAIQTLEGPGKTASPAAQMGAFAKQCAAKLGDRARNNSFAEIVEDIDRFRIAMGYDQINLWGGSFGTRLAQHYANAHGAHVRAIVLDATAPPGLSAFESVPQTSQAALDRLFTDCARDSACARAFPNLEGTFAALLSSAERNPKVVALPDPKSGQQRSFVFDADSIRGAVFGGLYIDLTRSVLPLAITRAAKGDFAPLAAISAATSSWSSDSMSLASTFSVICAEDWQQANELTSGQRSGGFMGDVYFRTFDAACREWPARAVGKEMLRPFRSAVPALAISGELDPVTPPRLAQQALAQFKTSVHLVIPGGLHTNSSNPCAARVIASFLDDPIVGGRDHSCLRPAGRAHFVMPPLSPGASS